MAVLSLHERETNTASLEAERVKLAGAYQALSLLKLDDMIATHLTVRSQDGRGFWLPPFGYLYEEMKASLMMQVLYENLEDPRINPTAAVFHNAVYKARPDIEAVFHVHTEAMIAVASMREGLRPLSQWALFFYDQVASYPYDGLALDHAAQSKKIAQALGDKKILLLPNHGAIICGESVEEALMNTYYLERACKAQCFMGARLDKDITVIPDDIALKAHNQLMRLEAPVGVRMFQAMMRKLDRLGVSYAD